MGLPPVLIETKRAMAVPGGYDTPPAAQPDILPPQQPVRSLKHDVAADDDQQGGATP